MHEQFESSGTGYYHSPHGDGDITASHFGCRIYERGPTFEQVRDKS